MITTVLLLLTFVILTALLQMHWNSNSNLAYRDQKGQFLSGRHYYYYLEFSLFGTSFLSSLKFFFWLSSINVTGIDLIIKRYSLR